MECKNCNSPLRTDYSYCPSCGARVIRNRLTFKNLWYDITERYFNLDNTFLKTFTHLFTKPETVIEGYIKGVRKKYLNPVSYLGIALTTSGILLFLIRNVFLEQIEIDVYNQGLAPEVADKIMKASLDYSSFMFVLYIPIFAISGWISINNKSYLLTENMVVFLYILSHWSIVTFPISLLLLIASPAYYLKIGIPVLFLMLVYSLYVMQRLHKLKLAPFLLRASVFSILIFIGYFGLVIIMYIILFITGTLTFEDFIPPK